MASSATGDDTANLPLELNTLYDAEYILNTGLNFGLQTQNDMIKSCQKGIGEIWSNYMKENVGNLGTSITPYLEDQDVNNADKYNFIANFYDWVPTNGYTQGEPYAPTTGCTTVAGDGWESAKEWLVKGGGSGTSPPDISITSTSQSSSESCPCWDCLTPNQKEQLINSNKDLWKGEVDKCIQGVKAQATPFMKAGASGMQGIEDIRNNLMAEQPNKFKNTYNSAILKADNLENKAITSKIMREEAKNIRNNLENIDGISINKIRMAEINTYYSEKYRLQMNIVKTCIFFGMLLIIIVLLHKKLHMPGFIYNIGTLIIVTVGGYYVIPMLYDIYMRDNINFQEYDWGDTDPTIDDSNPNEITHQPSLYEENSAGLNELWNSKFVKQTEDSLNPWECRGEECCAAGTSYDSSSNACIFNMNPVTTSATKKPVVAASPPPL
jgi:hypothetical protein